MQSHYHIPAVRNTQKCCRISSAARVLQSIPRLPCMIRSVTTTWQSQQFVGQKVPQLFAMPVTAGQSVVACLTCELPSLYVCSLKIFRPLLRCNVVQYKDVKMLLPRLILLRITLHTPRRVQAVLSDPTLQIVCIAHIPTPVAYIHYAVNDKRRLKCHLHDSMLLVCVHSRCQTVCWRRCTLSGSSRRGSGRSDSSR